MHITEPRYVNIAKILMSKGWWFQMNHWLITGYNTIDILTTKWTYCLHCLKTIVNLSCKCVMFLGVCMHVYYCWWYKTEVFILKIIYSSQTVSTSDTAIDAFQHLPPSQLLCLKPVPRISSKNCPCNFAQLKRVFPEWWTRRNVLHLYLPTSSLYHQL